MNGTSLRVVRAVNQSLKPGVDHCACSHGARFNCSKQVTVGETVVANGGTGLAQGNDLGVSGGIGVGKIAVPAAADKASLANHHGAYWDLACLESTLRGTQRLFHPEFVGNGSGQWLMVSGWLPNPI